MQSIFRLTWCSDPTAPKMSDHDALEKMCATNVLSKLKRKRTQSPDAIAQQRTHTSKKPRPEQIHLSANTRLPAKAAKEQTFTQASAPSCAEISRSDSSVAQSAKSVQTLAHPISTSDNMDNSALRGQVLDSVTDQVDTPMHDAQLTTPDDTNSLTPVQQVIENEFNMQILMKHNELRLIEQELAKCQIALEQLRRCELRPYPGHDGPSAAVSEGLGLSTVPPPGHARPSHAAPHGTTDGPYSRHYKQWLLRDTQFDSMPVGVASSGESPAHAASRSTRNSGSVRKSISKQFDFLGRLNEQQTSNSIQSSAPKDKSSPQIIRRSTDGQLVKLICNNCLRGNFSSIQGFLNHCRIAHKVDYKSHDLAAIDCGRLLDEHEAANLPAEAHSTPAAKPTSRTSTATNTPLRGLVHTFNTASGAPVAASNPRRAAPPLRLPVNNAPSTASSTAGSPFTPSPQLPHLSAYFAKFQHGGDLGKAAASAREKVDLGADDLPSPDVTEESSPLEPVAGSRTVVGGHTGLASTNSSMARPPSRKGFRQPTTQRPRPSPLAPAHSSSFPTQEHSEIPESPQDLTSNLSPHTADSNPGLVSDHEDDDHGSASEEESAPQTAMRRPIPVSTGSCEDNMEIDVAVEDDMDQHGVIIRRNSMFAEDERGLRAAGSPSRKLGGVGKRRV